jgi:hypothetical protein
LRKHQNQMDLMQNNMKPGVAAMKAEKIRCNRRDTYGSGGNGRLRAKSSVSPKADESDVEEEMTAVVGSSNGSRGIVS